MSRPSRKPLDRDLYDAVVAEAKSRFDVWPSAYASGWVVKTYKARGGRYGGGDRKTRSGLTKWFGEEWVDLSRPIHDEDGELVGYEPCGRKTAQDASNDPAAYPKCRPLAEAMRMSPSEVKDAIKRKRAAEAKAPRGGRGARPPVRVATYRGNPDTAFDWELPGTRGIREVTVDGVTVLYGYDGRSAHIASVRTKTKEQGQGKARRVLELFCAEADALGIPIRLEASPLTKKVNRARLVAFYESLGFEKTGRTINPAGDPEMVRLPVRANPYDPEDDPLSDVYVIATDELEDGTVVKYVASPFPFERKPLAYRDDPKAQGLVNLSTLIGTQRRVTVAGVEKYLAGVDEKPPRPGSSRMPAILVYETSDGRQYIADGHHRAFAALIRGLETFPAIIQLVRE